MIRIIKEGYVPKYTTVCLLCGCEFEFDEHDTESYISPDEIPCMARFVRCPCCQNRIESPQWKTMKDA